MTGVGEGTSLAVKAVKRISGIGVEDATTALAGCRKLVAMHTVWLGSIDTVNGTAAEDATTELGLTMLVIEVWLKTPGKTKKIYMAM